jgi:hypothetical protein
MSGSARRLLKAILISAHMQLGPFQLPGAPHVRGSDDDNLMPGVEEEVPTAAVEVAVLFAPISQQLFFE